MRLNHREFAALSADEPVGDAPVRFAKAQGTVAAITGAADLVTDGCAAHDRNGHPFMALVTASGCAALRRWSAPRLRSRATPSSRRPPALAAFAIAGEIAAQNADGPGSFALAIIDAVYNLDRATLRARLKLA